MSPVFRLVRPDLGHLVSHNPRILILNARFVVVICAALFASYMVLTFHVPTFEMSLAEKMASAMWLPYGFHHIASWHSPMEALANSVGFLSSMFL